MGTPVPLLPCGPPGTRPPPRPRLGAGAGSPLGAKGVQECGGEAASEGDLAWGGGARGRASRRPPSGPAGSRVSRQVVLLRNQLTRLLDSFLKPQPQDLLGLMEILGDVLHHLGAQGVGAVSVKMAQHLLPLFEAVRNLVPKPANQNSQSRHTPRPPPPLPIRAARAANTLQSEQPGRLTPTKPEPPHTVSHPTPTNQQPQQ